MADLILLEGMRFFAFHGNNPEERVLGQPFLVDLEVEADLSVAGRSDSLDDTINYAGLYRAVKGVMEGPARNLLEALAQDIADAVLGGFAVDRGACSGTEDGAADTGRADGERRGGDRAQAGMRVGVRG